VKWRTGHAEGGCLWDRRHRTPIRACEQCLDEVGIRDRGRRCQRDGERLKPAEGIGRFCRICSPRQDGHDRPCKLCCAVRLRGVGKRDAIIYEDGSPLVLNEREVTKLEGTILTGCSNLATTEGQRQWLRDSGSEGGMCSSDGDDVARPISQLAAYAVVAGDMHLDRRRYR